MLWLFSSQYCKLWTHLTSSFIFLANNTARSIILLMILTYIWVNEIRICHIRVTNISWLEVSLESCQTFGMDFFCGNSVWNPLKIIFVKKLHHRYFSASKCASDAVVVPKLFRKFTYGECLTVLMLAYLKNSQCKFSHKFDLLYYHNGPSIQIDRNTRKKCEICSKLIKTPERCQRRCSCVFNINFLIV